MSKRIRDHFKDMAGALIWLYAIAFIILAFFGPWAARLASASDIADPQTSYVCILTSGVGFATVTPTRGGFNYAHVDGSLPGTFAFGSCAFGYVEGSTAIDVNTVNCSMLTSYGSAAGVGINGNPLALVRNEFMLACSQGGIF